MGVKLMLSCDGCHAAVECAEPLLRETRHTSLTPEGWVMYDTYTQFTYCPKCIDEIFCAPCRNN